MDTFVHLHVHSRFSFMDGAADLDELIARAVALEMPAIALTDHQGLSGAIRFYQKALGAGIKPIIGAEIVIEPLGISGDEGDAPPRERLSCPPPVGFGRAAGAGFHLTLLARDREGYANVCRLLSAMHVRSKDAPSVATLEDLARCRGGLIVLTGCINGEVGQAVLAGQRSRATSALIALARIAEPGGVYVEVQNLLTPDSPRYVSTLVELARSLDLPIVATNDVHYVHPHDARLHDVLAAAGSGIPLPGPDGRMNS